jgi:hypothetical protein
MARRSIAVVLALLVAAGIALAADKEVRCKLIRVDVNKNVLTVTTEDGKTEHFEVNENTKFIGPKGGLSERGIKDERLVRGVELKLVIAGNNRTIHEVHIPERNSRDK